MQRLKDMVGTGSGQFRIRSVIKHVNNWFRGNRTKQVPNGFGYQQDKNKTNGLSYGVGFSYKFWFWFYQNPNWTEPLPSLIEPNS